MRISQIVSEASYDSMIVSMKTKSPDWAPVIDWAKTLKRQDRVVWYLNIVKKLIANPNDTVALGGAASIEDLQGRLVHYIGQGIPKIESYQFGQQPASEVFTELAAIETTHQSAQDKTAPVAVKKGDKELIKFADGTAWWFVDRAYCADEGRSGQHCGNVVGRTKRDQRILSYRINGRVAMTFILEPDGYLGEMKGKGNLKPNPKFHPHIVSLLLNPMIKGIRGAGYIPEMNFSLFDLSDDGIKTVSAQKPSFISDQITATPMELLRAPAWIRSNPQYKQIAVKVLPGVNELIDGNGDLNTSTNSWESAIAKSPGTILYAPSTIKNYQDRVGNLLVGNPRELLNSPKSIRFNFDILSSAISRNTSIVRYMLPTTPRYNELCKFAISKEGDALQYVPEALRDNEMCKVAVSKEGSALRYVPEALRDQELCKIAISKEGYALRYVPEALRDRDMCKFAVSKSSYALSHVPEALRDRELCKIAVTQQGDALQNVPEFLRDQELCKIAMSKNGDALRYVPEALRDRDMYKLAVLARPNLDLKEVPKEFRDRELCKMALSRDGGGLKEVPKELRDQELCKIAVSKNGQALTYVPLKLRDRELCKIAVTNDSAALRFVPNKLRDRELCKLAVSRWSPALEFVPEELRDRELCKIAVSGWGPTIEFVPDHIKPLLNQANESKELSRIRQLINY